MKYILKTISSAMVLAMALSGALQAAQSPQISLLPSKIPQFAQALPTLTNMQPVDGTTKLTFSMCEFDANILPPGTPVTPAPVKGQPPSTKVWGYINGDCPTNNVIPSTQSYLGPAVIAKRGTPTEINFVNALGTADSTGVLAYKYSTDQTLHWADPLGGEQNDCNKAGGIPGFGTPCAQNYAGPIPAVPHLHGGEVPPVLDGGPDAWWTKDGMAGHAYYSMDMNSINTGAAIYRYPNEQEAAPIWFHDHTLGATRLNVYAGLAGAYLITDPTMTLAGGLTPTGLKSINYWATNQPSVDEPTVPLVIQDRMFDTKGQLFFPADSAGGVLWAINPDHPYWVPEFTGDTIAVNGKVWPYLNVQAKRYRFLILNGSNARTYQLTLANLPLWVIANDGGYLDTPAKVTTLTIMPGERYEVIIDFAGQSGKTLIMTNSAKTPYPAGAQPPAGTLGRIVQFRVNPAGATTTPVCGGRKQPVCVADPSYNPATLLAIRPTDKKMVRLVNAATGTLAPGVSINSTRQLTLNEVMAPATTVTNPVTGVLTNYPGGPLEILVNNTLWEGCNRTLGDFTPVTVGGNTTCYSEVIDEGATELWEIVNMTADAHPMHIHLANFQILNRQAYNTKNYIPAYNAAFLGGLYIPGFGPPLDYNTGISRALGGNPDITPFLVGAPRPPAAYESGWKDTVIAYPGEVTRIVVRFAPNSTPVGATNEAAAYPFDPNAGGHGYVWHCHIIDHEDNEMMRPSLINPINANDRDYKMGADY